MSGPIERVDVMLRSMDQGMSFDEKCSGMALKELLQECSRK